MTALPKNKLKPVALALAAAAGVLVIAGLAYLFLTPKSYEARARIKVIHWIHASEADPAADLDLVRSESGVLRSNALLDQTIQDLKLRELWGKRFHGGAALSADDARALLNSRLFIEPVTDSELIDIRAKSEDREEPAKIANTLAQAYLDLRGVEHQNLLEQKRNALKQQWADENDKLSKAQALVDKEYFEIMKGRQTNTVRVYDTEGYVSNRVKLEAQYIAQKSELAGFKKMNEDALAQVLSSMDTNSVILPLLTQLNKAKADELNAKLDHGPDSREEKDATLVVNRIRHEISRYLASALAMREDKLTALNSSLTEMDARVKNSAPNLEEAKSQYSEYTNALQNLNNLKEERDKLQKTMAVFEEDSATATAVTAELIDSAETPAKPSVPNGRLAMGIMITGLICAVAALIVLLVGQRQANVATTV
jgi:uncharacterized protein involved in exopolysaccharide biosynthesis